MLKLNKPKQSEVGRTADLLENRLKGPSVFSENRTAVHLKKSLCINNAPNWKQTGRIDD